MYGYEDDNVKNGPSIFFGLNSGVTKMVKFEWTDKGGKEGAEMEALDIVFNVNGKEMKYRQFPITKAFDNGKEITNPTHPAMVKAVNDFNALMTHIITCFVDKETYKAALQKQPITSFKSFCNLLKSLLPVDFATISLDIFLQYQYKINGENSQTFFEIPKKTNHGKFLCRTFPAKGTWSTKKIENPEDKVKCALWYTDNEGNIHPFIRTGWFMNSNFANVQKEENSSLPAGLGSNTIDMSGSNSLDINDSTNVNDEWK